MVYFIFVTWHRQKNMDFGPKPYFYFIFPDLKEYNLCIDFFYLWNAKHLKISEEKLHGLVTKKSHQYPSL